MQFGKVDGMEWKLANCCNIVSWLGCYVGLQLRPIEAAKDRYRLALIRIVTNTAAKIRKWLVVVGCEAKLFVEFALSGVFKGFFVVNESAERIEHSLAWFNPAFRKQDITSLCKEENTHSRGTIGKNSMSVTAGIAMCV